jgi:hypothetical protein
MYEHLHIVKPPHYDHIIWGTIDVRLLDVLGTVTLPRSFAELELKDAQAVWADHQAHRHEHDRPADPAPLDSAGDRALNEEECG